MSVFKRAKDNAQFLEKFQTAIRYADMTHKPISSVRIEYENGVTDVFHRDIADALLNTPVSMGEKIKKYPGTNEILSAIANLGDWVAKKSIEQELGKKLPPNWNQPVIATGKVEQKGTRSAALYRYIG